MSPKRFLGPLRAVLLVVGVLILCYGVYFGATLPEPPPNSDGVPTGFAVVYVLLVQSVGALVAQVGYALPAGTGRFRFGPLADSPAVVRAAGATAVFVTAVALVTAFGWVLPDSLPRVVTGTHAFLWFGAVAGSAVGVVFTAVVAVATVLWRLVHGEPVLGAGVDG